MPDTSDDLITIREGDLVESLTMAMHTEHLDDETCNSVIATLLDAITNDEQASPAIAAKPTTELGPEGNDLPPWPIGTVVRDVETGRRIVLTHPLLRSDAYEFVCEKAHGEKPYPDYSYLCNNRYCRCLS
jgi:hypothetical protein